MGVTGSYNVVGRIALRDLNGTKHVGAKSVRIFEMARRPETARLSIPFDPKVLEGRKLEDRIARGHTLEFNEDGEKHEHILVFDNDGEGTILEISNRYKTTAFVGKTWIRLPEWEDYGYDFDSGSWDYDGREFHELLEENRLTMADAMKLGNKIRAVAKKFEKNPSAHHTAHEWGVAEAIRKVREVYPLGKDDDHLM